MKFPDRNTIKKQYDARSGVRRLVIKDLIDRFEEVLCVLSSRPAVRGRQKDFDSFYRKYLKLLKNHEEPALTDLIGLRVICPFLEDLRLVEKTLREHFSVLEVDKKGAHFSFKEFGYESVHLLINIPAEIIKKRGNPGCTVAEVQVRTILQDAWAEVEHELVYKAEFTPFDDPLKRKLAAVNASLSLADSIFQEIRSYQKQLNNELGKRRDSFYRKIGEETDALLFEDFEDVEESGEKISRESVDIENATIDELLLNALYAHNKNQFADAIRFYSRILDLKPDNSIVSLIHKHRGMANFAQSSYDDAIEDFTRALEYDPASYKAAYYRGVVKSVLRRYLGAIEDFSLSLSINPYQNFTLYRRAQAYYHLGDYPAALGDCEASLALSPECEQAVKFRDILKEKLKMLG
ncbi:MAG: tetratricopeptide repeat protein [Treponema sp.]|jgi:putative GTP pyrophosphokinase|nr:tetratricopeptide repeat protein [Treponema sp.]